MKLFYSKDLIFCYMLNLQTRLCYDLNLKMFGFSEKYILFEIK